MTRLLGRLGRSWRYRSRARAVSFVFGLAGACASTTDAVNPKQTTTTDSHAAPRRMGRNTGSAFLKTRFSLQNERFAPDLTPLLVIDLAPGRRLFENSPEPFGSAFSRRLRDDPSPPFGWFEQLYPWPTGPKPPRLL